MRFFSYNFWVALAVLTLIVSSPSAAMAGSADSLLNVSYDPTRELFDDYNKLFAAHWQKKNGQDISIRQSHGGSGKQARSVIDGLGADVVTLALAYDIDAIAKDGLLPTDWQSKLPHNSSPYTSTIVLLVRKGNPKNIKDWPDLVRSGVSVITPNPKTSGGARWNYLAAYGYALKANNGDAAKAEAYLQQLFRNVPILDAGARAATMTFVQRRMGDVLLTWENEAHLAKAEFGKDQVEIIIPSISIRAEPPVAVVTKNSEARGTTALAEGYLRYLYSKKAQHIVAAHYFRPVNEKILSKYSTMFPEMPMQTIADFGGWEKAQRDHFADGGLFDRIYAP